MTIEQIDCKNAYSILLSDSNSVLIDVRTDHEIKSYGQPDLSKALGSKVNVAWKLYPKMEFNKDFNKNLKSFIDENFSEEKGEKENLKLLFMCAAGVRSFEAANDMSAQGFECYNIMGGTEGGPDFLRNQTNINGWKAEKLPWRLT